MFGVLLATCTGAMYVCDYKNNLDSTNILNRKKKTLLKERWCKSVEGVDAKSNKYNHVYVTMYVIECSRELCEG